MKSYHLCHWRLGCAAPLVTHQQNYDHTGERRQCQELDLAMAYSATLPTLRAVIELTRNSNIRFNIDASREYEITSNFPVLRFFGHSAGLDRR